MALNLHRAEHAAAAALLTLLCTGMFAVAAVHTIELAVWAGQARWAAYVVAGTGEAMATRAFLEIRHRRRTGVSTRGAVAVLAASIGFSGVMNVAAAVIGRDSAGQLTGDAGAWRPIIAVWVVIAFALAGSLHWFRPAVPVPAATPAATPDSAPVPEDTPTAVPVPAVEDSTPEDTPADHAPAPLALVPRPAGDTPTSEDTHTPPASEDTDRTDGDLYTLLADVPRDQDGYISVRRAATAMGCGKDRAQRILTAHGLARPRTAAAG
ncbi:hypothetical protein [Parafrankia discariae]|uniref:hypothetical protein n=1 Tax=Parafrankia discariae TaxID=365528 RepID=UPI000369941F|nr:hypothetical protein [Parafrankia discariae]